MLTSRRKPTQKTGDGWFPATCFQAGLLDVFSDPECTHAVRSGWLISRAIHVRPSVSPRRLERAIKRLLARHDVLTLQFRKQPGKGWVSRIADAQDFELTIHDFGEDGFARLEDLCNEVASQPMELIDSRLVEFHLLRFGRHGDVILPRIHHLVVDGFGMVIMAEDLIKLVVNFPLTGKPLSHMDYVREIEARLPGPDSDETRYWLDLLSDPPPPVSLHHKRHRDGTASGLARSAQAGILPLDVDLQLYETLESIAQQANASLFCLFVSVFSQVVEDMSGSKDFLMDMMYTRADGRMSDYVGMHGHIAPLRLRGFEGLSTVERAGKISKQIKKSSSHLTRSTTAKFCDLDSLLTAHGASRHQFAVHIGAADARARNSMFAKLFLAQDKEEISVGPLSVSSVPLNTPVNAATELFLNVIPHENGAKLAFLYDMDCLEETTVRDFAALFEAKLRALT